MLRNKKRVFWEALLLTLIIFILGMLIGASFERGKLDEIEQYYTKSEILFMDLFALNERIDSDDTCEVLMDSNIQLADNIYEEAFLLEKYEAAGKITEGLKLAHRKYDMLRTYLWMNTIDISEKCKGEFNSVVYLYEYNTDDLAVKATQNVWARVLFDLKQEKGNTIILIPIAVNSDLVSLDALLKDFEISRYPVVIIDEEHVVEEISSVEDLKIYLD
ncbi:unnamed protein product [marine sediment metagenome]|uniref:Uncharacterized protein n=1 Tax=marine sediment metagenome TaxID=412755 RepID=X1FCX7_9ZZZZ